MPLEHIPIIGLPGEVLTWFPTSVVRCNCKPGEQRSLVFLIGFGRPAMCPQCGTIYEAVGVEKVRGGYDMQINAVKDGPKV